MKRNMHTSPDLFSPEDTTNIFDPDSDKFIGQIKAKDGKLITMSARTPQMSLFQSLSEGIQFIATLKKARERRARDAWGERMDLYNRNIKNRFSDV